MRTKVYIIVCNFGSSNDANKIVLKFLGYFNRFIYHYTIIMQYNALFFLFST